MRFFNNLSVTNFSGRIHDENAPHGAARKNDERVTAIHAGQWEAIRRSIMIQHPSCLTASEDNALFHESVARPDAPHLTCPFRRSIASAPGKQPWNNRAL